MRQLLFRNVAQKSNPNSRKLALYRAEYLHLIIQILGAEFYLE